MVRGWACSEASLAQAGVRGWPCTQAGVPGDWDGGVSAGRPRLEVRTLGLGFGAQRAASESSLWPRPRPAPTTITCVQGPSPWRRGCQRPSSQGTWFWWLGWDSLGGDAFLGLQPFTLLPVPEPTARSDPAEPRRPFRQTLLSARTYKRPAWAAARAVRPGPGTELFLWEPLVFRGLSL